MLVQYLRIALSALARHRLRTLLTVLGIGIGIAAVICTAALGAAGSARVRAQMDALGEDFLWIRAGSPNVAGVRTGFGGVQTLTAADGAALVSSVPAIQSCSPLFTARQQIVSGGSNWNTRYQAVLPSFFAIRHRTLAAGAAFTDYDVSTDARVIVLGADVADRLFDGENPVGRTVRMNKFPFTVIGVLASRGADRSGLDRDDVVFVPLSTATRTLVRRTWVTDIMCGIVSPERMTEAQEQAAMLLRVRHDLAEDAPDDFRIEQPLDTLQVRAQSAATMTLMLTAVGAISLVVGGVGIMNIMLVSVTERRREIGVRLAIGARMRDIRWQFLTEASLLGLLGGALGMALALAGSVVLGSGFGWRMSMSADVSIGAMLAAIAAAVLFGYLPAHRASRLDPIEAIRADA